MLCGYNNNNLFFNPLRSSVAPPFTDPQPLRLIVDPQSTDLHHPLGFIVAPHSNHSAPTLSTSIAPQSHHLHPTSSRSVAPQLNPHAAPFVPQEMRAAKEYNSRTVPQVTSTLNPNAAPFVSRKSTCSISMTTEGSGLTSSTQKQAITTGQKRMLGEPKEEDVVFCKARKENEQGEPPRKKHCSISIAQSYPRPCTLIEQESSTQAGQQVKESKSSAVEQPLDCTRSTTRAKRASATDREMRDPLRPITNKAKVQKHNNAVTTNAKKAAMAVVKAAAKEAERMKHEKEKRKEQKKRRERSRQIDVEALERRRIMAQQQQMLDDDLVARARFLHEYAERIAYIKKERYMNRTPKNISPCYDRAVYNIYRELELNHESTYF